MMDKLRSTWAQVLDIPDTEIESTSNFFELGGDSVAAARLVAAANQIGINVTIDDVFDSADLEELSKTCQTLSKTGDGSASGAKSALGWSYDDSVYTNIAAQCGLSSNQIEDVFPCLPMQTTLVRRHLLSGDWVLQIVYRCHPSTDLSSFQEAWSTLQLKMPILRTRIVDHDTETLQVIVREPVQWVEATNLEEYKKNDSGRRMELGQPLLRLALVNEDRETFFVCTIHHAIQDRPTRKMIIDDLSALLQNQQPPNRPDLKGYVRHMLSVDRSDAIDHYTTIFRGSSQKQLESFYAQDQVLPQQIMFKAESKNYRMQTSTNAAITFSTVLQLAWAIALANLSGLDDVVYSIIRSGRQIPFPGISNLPGPTLQRAPCRVKILPEEPLRDALHKVQRLTREGIPYEQFSDAIVSDLLGTTAGTTYSQSLLLIQSSPEPFADDIECGSMEMEVDQGLSTKYRSGLLVSRSLLAAVTILGPDEIGTNFEWNETLMATSKVEAVREDFVSIAREISRLPDTTVGKWSKLGNIS